MIKAKDHIGKRCNIARAVLGPISLGIFFNDPEETLDSTLT